MSDVMELNLVDDTQIDQGEDNGGPKVQIENNSPTFHGDSNGPKVDETPMACPQHQEETIKNRYGGLLAKKPSLISKDHERAFFDSADWALGKQGGQKTKGPLEALCPKLQPTPHQQVRSRRSAYAPADDIEHIGHNNEIAPENESCEVDDDCGDDVHFPTQCGQA